MNNSFEEIRKAIDAAEIVAVMGHVNPDGDAVGASCALALMLEKLGKKVYVLLEDFAEKFKVADIDRLIYRENYENLKCDLAICVDCSDAERLGRAKEVFYKAPKSICIDHHVSKGNFGDLNYIDATASSSSELVFWLSEGAYELDKDIAALLYLGIIYDTGGFRHSNTGSKTMIAASKLMAYGIDFSEIYNEAFYTRNYSEAKILARAIDKSKSLFDGIFVYTIITKKDIEECESSEKELDEISAFLKGIKGCEVSALFSERDGGKVKVSLRSGNKIDVCRVAGAFGGGGHVKAAGCTINGSVDEACHMVTEFIKDLL